LNRQRHRRPRHRYDQAKQYEPTHAHSIRRNPRGSSTAKTISRGQASKRWLRGARLGHPGRSHHVAVGRDEPSGVPSADRS
jgi:hypothetical protein